MVYRSTHSVISHYSEGGIEYGIIPRAGNIIGGTATNGRIYLGPDASLTDVIGAGRFSNTPLTWVHKDKDFEHGASMGRKGGSEGWRFFHTHDPDSSINSGLSWIYSKLRKAYQLTKNNRSYLSLTTRDWSLGNYKGEHLYFPEGFILGGFKVARMTTEYNFKIIPEGREFTKGDVIIFTSDPTYCMAFVTRGGSKSTTLEMRGVEHGPVIT